MKNIQILGIALILVSTFVEVDAQEISKHPLDGAWKWHSVDEDGTKRQGFRWYWTDGVVGLQRVAHVSIDPETLEPVSAWSAFQTIQNNQIGDRLWADSNGRLGRSTERFEDKGSVVTFSGSSENGNVSGQIELSWNKKRDEFSEYSVNVIGFDKSYIEKTPSIEAQKIDYNPGDKGEVVWAKNKIKTLDPRLEDLHGSWESIGESGNVNLKILFREFDLGASLHERFVFFDEEGNPTGGGYNLTRRNHANGELVMYSITKNGFSQVGGWDFMGSMTTGQRQGDSRLVRSFLSLNEIHAKWQSKENGIYTDVGGGYILKRKQNANIDNAEDSNAKTKRSYFQRTKESQRFTGYIKTDFKIVADQDVQSYLAAEEEWKGLHEQRMQRGSLLHWHVAKIKNANMGEPNYATVQVYASMEDMQNGSIWDTLDYSAVGSRADLGERTWPYVQSAGSDIYQAVDQYWSPNSGGMDIRQINMGYMNVQPGKIQDYLFAEMSMAKPFWQIVSSMDPTFGGWALHRLIESNRSGITHDFVTAHFKSAESLPGESAWQSTTQKAMSILNKPNVEWGELRKMASGPQFEILIKANHEFHPVKNEWKKLKGSWKHTNEDGSYRIKHITQGTEQLELYDSDGLLKSKFILPMKIEVKGGLNHFYSFHANGTYHSIYKIKDNKWYEQMRGIWRDSSGEPTKFLIYEKL